MLTRVEVLDENRALVVGKRVWSVFLNVKANQQYFATVGLL